MARRFASRGAIQAPKRQIANEALDGFATLTFGASTTNKALGSFGFVLLVPAATLVRTRGLFTAFVLSNGTIDSIIQITMGLTVVSSDAFNIGLTALPGPISDSERMWQVWQPAAVIAQAVAPNQEAFGIAQSQPVDSRGMRKMKAGDVLAAVFEGEQLAATTGTIVRVAYTLRMQFKL